MRFYKNRYFNPAVFLMLCAALFKFGQGGVTWFWVAQPVVAAILLATSAAFWILLFSSHRKSQQ